MLGGIGRMAQATTDQLRRLFFGIDASTPLRRLRKLRAMGFVEVHVLHEDEPNIYTLTAAGMELLVQHGFDRSTLHRARVGRHRDLHLEHLNDLRVELVLAARAARGLELRAFHADLDLRRAAGAAMPDYIPDAVIELVVGTQELVLMAEVDTGTEGLGVFSTKVDRTVALWQSGARCWGALAGTWRPVVFVPTATRAKALARFARHSTGGLYAGIPVTASPITSVWMSCVPS